MSNAPYRAFRFGHPIFDDPEGPLGVSLTSTGRANMVDGAASVRQAIMLLLSTTPGERVMRPDYGCNLYRLAFAVNDDTTAGLAIHYTRMAIQTWEPRVDQVRVDANRNPDDPGRLDITVSYRVRKVLRTEQLTFPISLDGGAR
jgi:phage baseplate assembly protein W